MLKLEVPLYTYCSNSGGPILLGLDPFGRLRTSARSRQKAGIGQSPQSDLGSTETYKKCQIISGGKLNDCLF